MERRVRFGPFVLDRQTGELRKEGVRIKLQSRPRQILLALLERPGEAISRKELKQRQSIDPPGSANGLPLFGWGLSPPQT